MLCKKHNKTYAAFCTDCMMENHNTVYGGGATVTYYPPGAGQSALTPVADMVNSPSHYTQGGIETIDYIQAKLSQEEFIGYLKGNILKYVSRAGLKDEIIQEYDKASWYLERLKDVVNTK